MDEIIRDYPAVADGDLMLCPDNGTAYQRDMSIRVPYDESYFNKCLGYEDKEIALKINAGRIALVDLYVGHDKPVLDVGIGSGEFIKKRPLTFGYDVNPAAERWLRAQHRWRDDFETFRAFTFWDVLEHVERPADYFGRMPGACYLFTSLPIFDDLTRIRESKHYRPGEHLYYWTAAGFVAWMKLHRFGMLCSQSFEIEAGRESILSFAFYRAS